MREQFIKEYLSTFEIPEKSKEGKSYITAIVYGYRTSGMSSEGYSRFVKKYFPEKLSNHKVFNYILSTLDLKYCGNCGNILDKSCFYENKSNTDGLNSQCKKCQLQKTAETQPHRSSLYRANLLQQTPKWADLEEIKNFYANCPEGYQVDHIIPLNGKNVRGLHVIENLQYLTKEDNIRKSNKVKN